MSDEPGGGGPVRTILAADFFDAGRPNRTSGLVFPVPLDLGKQY